MFLFLAKTKKAKSGGKLTHLSLRLIKVNAIGFDQYE
jgi:hypothetical protein